MTRDLPRTVRRRLRSALIAPLLGALVLTAAGCSDPQPTPPPLHGSSGVGSPTPSSSAGSTGSTGSAGSPSPTPSGSAQPTPTPTPDQATTADRAAGQKAVEVFLAGVNDAADAKSDAAVKGTWQQSCIWCATVIQPVQMAAFAKSWRLTPARVRDPRITYWKQGINGQLLYRVTMSVSAMKLVDGTGSTQRSSAAVQAGSFSFAAQEIGSNWQVVQGIQGEIEVPTP